MALRIVTPREAMKANLIPSDALPATVTVEDFCDVKGAAALLGVHPSVIHRAVHDNKVPVMRLGKIGRVWRFYKPDLLKMREGGRR